MKKVNQPPISYSLERFITERQTKISETLFRQDLLISLGITIASCVFILSATQQPEKTTLLFSFFFFLYISSYLLNRLDYHQFALISYFTLNFLIPIWVIFNFPFLKNESLLYFSSAISAIFFIPKKGSAVLVFTFFTLTAIGFGVYELQVQFLHDTDIGENQISQSIPIIFFVSMLIRCLAAFWLYRKFLYKLTQKQEEISETATHYKDIYNLVQEGVLEIDTNGIIQSCNNAGKGVFKGGQLKGTPFHHLLTETGKEKWDQAFSILQQKGYASPFETKIAKNLKPPQYITINAIAKYDQSGNFVGSRNIIREITIEKLQALALEESEKRYRTLFENTPLGLLIADIDKQKKGLACNETMAVLMQTSKQATLDGNMLVFSPTYQPDGERSSDRLHEYLTIFRKKRVPIQLEWQFKTAKGKLIWCDVIFSPIQLAGEDHMLLIATDISDRKRQDQIIQNQIQALNLKNEELQKYIDSNLQLENFAYMASHDLKAPLRSIISFTQLLERSFESPPTSTQSLYFEYVKSASKNMHHLIGDLLSYSLVNSDAFTLTAIRIEEMIASIETDLLAQIESQQGQLSIGQLPTEIHADATRIRQLFQNLISNALKFSRPGVRPHIQVSCEELAHHWQFSIQDNGIGIEEAFREKIFLLFRRLHSPAEYEGTGIGLAICKKIVEQHGGLIWLDSTPGQGSTFYFTLQKRVNIPNLLQTAYLNGE